MRRSYPKQFFVAYPKFKFKWVSAFLFAKSDKPTHDAPLTVEALVECICVPGQAHLERNPEYSKRISPYLEKTHCLLLCFWGRTMRRARTLETFWSRLLFIFTINQLDILLLLPLTLFLHVYSEKNYLARLFKKTNFMCAASLCLPFSLMAASLTHGPDMDSSLGHI